MELLAEFALWMAELLLEVLPELVDRLMEGAASEGLTRKDWW